MPFRGRVFLIDEDPVFSAVGEVVFGGAGALEVIAVDNTESAIGELAAKATHRDIAVLGLNMSGLDGLAIMRILATGHYKGFIAVSSDESAAIRDSATRLAKLLKLRVLGEIIKPLREAEVRALLQQAALADEELVHDSYGGRVLIGDLCPVYQPKFDSVSGEIVGAEALMRLETADGTLASPFAHIEKVTLEGRSRRRDTDISEACPQRHA